MKTHLVNHNDKKILITTRTPPIIEILTYFYYFNKTETIFIKSNFVLNINYFDIWTKLKFFWSTILYIKYTFMPTLTCSLDYFLYKGKTKYNLLLNTTSLLSNLRFNVHLALEQSLHVPTLAQIFFNNLWLEREILDFSEITIYHLKDTRRLLLDYLQTREYPSLSLINEYTYNHILNDLYTLIWLVHF